jgi:hypothetical protein
VEGVTIASVVEEPSGMPADGSPDTSRAHEELAERVRVSIEQHVLSELERAFGDLGATKDAPSDEER